MVGSKEKYRPLPRSGGFFSRDRGERTQRQANSQCGKVCSSAFLELMLRSSMVKMAAAQAELERKGEKGMDIDAEAQAQMMNHGLDALWKMGKMEIEKTCRTVCQVALNNDKVSDKAWPF